MVVKAHEIAGASSETLLLFVVGAHLSGEPLNYQLTELGGRLAALGRAAAGYRMYALPGIPARPGMVRAAAPIDRAIEGEVWALSPGAFGRFVNAVPAPLTIGKVQLETGESISGFLCESYAVANCPEITAFGGWRRYLQRSLAPTS